MDYCNILNGLTRSNTIFIWIGWIIGLLSLDAVVYGKLLPVLAIFITVQVGRLFDITVLNEVILSMTLTFGLISLALNMKIENLFWKHVFMQLHAFKWILLVRDALNLWLIYENLICLIKSVSAIGRDGNFKSKLLGQGVEEEIFRSFSRINEYLPPLYFDPMRGILNQTKTHQEAESAGRWFGGFMTTSVHPNPISLDNLQKVHASEFISSIAELTASVTKLLYFNTLHTYIRSVETLVKIQEENADYLFKQDTSVFTPAESECALATSSNSELDKENMNLERDIRTKLLQNDPGDIKCNNET